MPDETKLLNGVSLALFPSNLIHLAHPLLLRTVLDQYARQNVAEIDEIPLETEVINVQLPGAEMALVLVSLFRRRDTYSCFAFPDSIYRELEHHLYNIDPALYVLSCLFLVILS